MKSRSGGAEVKFFDNQQSAISGQRSAIGIQYFAEA
jgi:hypothetical protein